MTSQAQGIFVKRFYDPKLAQASYLIGSRETGTSIVIDPNRDIEQYIRSAAEEDLSITHVTETHIHADFVSGSRDLATATGARLYLSGCGGPEWRYSYAAASGAVLLNDGDRLELGCVRIAVLHTPGHAPEHLTFLVTDHSTFDEPVAAATGDFLFVGDVGRPDLLENGAAEGASDAARVLFRSLARLRGYSDHLQIWPGHGAGSACGKGISALPQSTLGYERRSNWALTTITERDFVEQLLSGQPDPPTYFRIMKRLNQEGPPLPRDHSRPPHLSLDRLATLVAEHATIIDLRPATAFAAGHIPGTVNIPLDRAFTTWAGGIVPYDHDSYLLLDDRGEECLREAMRDLSLIGLDRIAGYAEPQVLQQWTGGGNALRQVTQVDAAGVLQALQAGAAEVIDVRTRPEWEQGHIAGARHLALGALPSRIDTLPRDRPLIVHCQTGVRSAIAASLLDAGGFSDVSNLTGGFDDWQAAGLAVERERNRQP